MIEIKSLFELILVTLVIKLVVVQWTPPIQRSLQAILVIFIGTVLGCVINPTVDGFITGIIASGFSFYGGELVKAFKDVSKEVDEISIKKVK